MQLEHSFSVPVPVEVAWRALLDPQRVAPCFPGATLTGIDGDEFTGTVKVRMGPIALLYKGAGRFTSIDESARRAVIEATGKDSRGNGTASATVSAVLNDEGDSTTVGVITDLTITGRPAQLGRGLVGEVGGKILNAFAACLATQLTGSETPPVDGPSTGVDRTNGPFTGMDRANGPSTGQPAAPGSPEQTVPRPRPANAADEIDLLDVAEQPVLKRLVPVAAGVLAALLVLRWLRRRH